MSNQQFITTARSLYDRVRAGFVLQGTSLHRYCVERNLSRQNVRKALLGEWKGPKADSIVTQLIKASSCDQRNVA